MRVGIPRAVITLCLLLSVLQGSAVTAAATSPDPTTDAQQTGLTILIQLQTDGDARVSLIWNKSLQNASDTHAFNSMKNNFENGLIPQNTEIVELFNRTVDEVRKESNRPMSVRDVSRNMTQSGDTGQFVISFTWTNFATTRDDGEYIDVGDAFETANESWLSSLRADQELVIRPPPEYRINSASIGHEDDTIRFNGSDRVDPLYITYESDSLIPSSVKNGPISPLVLAVGTAFLALAVGVFVFSRRQRVRGLIPIRLISNSPIESDQPSAIDTEPETPQIEANPPESESAVNPVESDAMEDGIDPELLSDEERVERLLRKNGGRMKQAAIVTETGWSNAKVSLLLSSMDEAERIEKLRIGRENLISLPSEENDPINNADNQKRS